MHLRKTSQRKRQLNQGLKDRQECPGRRKTLITALGFEFRIVHSGDSRKDLHTTDVLKTKGSEKVEGMMSLTGLGMPGGKSG